MIEIVSFPGPDRSVTGDILKELHLTEGRNPVASWGMVRLHSSFFRASFHQEEFVQNEFTDRDELRCFLLAVSGIHRMQ